ncbi:MarR family winged helix-turn-helix transcriptional regulator [Arthrobacter sp. W4I7]|uniref:MarR family winged helix-turn-helix transcriptional regulator n=1 Tax=Arthrobacter sp. W4I7 TaxID=3042296 RepID=UPI00278A8082|nr:DNA-binding MarR family transcriptional regulator [Arthrobacter sp. W4I7]
MPDRDVRGNPVLQQVEHELTLLWSRARSISLQLSRQVHRKMEPAAYGLLTAIHREGFVRLTGLATIICVGKPSVSRQITFLESEGLVCKEADPLDRRAQVIRLTEKGEKEMHRVQEARKQVFRDRLGGWPLEDLQRLADYMERLNDVYSSGLPEGVPLKAVQQDRPSPPDPESSFEGMAAQAKQR